MNLLNKINMSKKYLLPNNYDIPYSHFLDKELRKSL